MVEILFCKFKSDENMRNKLLNTGNSHLYEASPYDKIWGIGYAKEDAINVHHSRYGQNLLGKALMLVRNLLRNY